MRGFIRAPELAEEVELKFAIPEAEPALVEKRLPARGRKARKRLRSVYYDTPDLELRRRGVGLRVRQVDGHHVQTIKCDGRGAERLECEHEIKGERPDLTCVEEAGLQQLFSDVGAPALLQPIFATEIDRTAWQFDHKGAAIECAVDQGEIRAGDKRMPVRELELELKGGASAGLFDAAEPLNRTLHLRTEWESKGERGYALAAGPAAEPPQRSRLKPKMKTGEALALIAGDCVAQIAYHAPRVRREGGVEGVHDMRVAVRRLRAALGTFRRAMGDRRLAFEDDLRWLQDQLGAVRDWDVFLETAVQPIEGEERDVVLVDEASAQARAEAYEALCAALDATRCTALWLAIMRWLRTLPHADAGTPALARPVRKYARAELRRRARKLDKRGRRIEKLEEAELHQLRIGAKKLRYAAEFFRDIFPKKRVKRTLASMKGLQDLLGDLNDTRTARTLLAGLQPKQGGGQRALALAHGDGVIEGAVLARAHADHEQLRRQWRRYDRAKKPWD